jgi:hypothetical protein
MKRKADHCRRGAEALCRRLVMNEGDVEGSVEMVEEEPNQSSLQKHRDSSYSDNFLDEEGDDDFPGNEEGRGWLPRKEEMIG